MSNLKVSVIMPSLNVVNYIDECIQSVISQTLTAYSARTAHPFRRNGAPFRFKLSKAQLVD